MIEVIARNRFACRDGHFAAVGYRQDAMAYCTEALPIVSVVPAHPRHRKRSQKIGMAVEDTEATALVFGAHCDDIWIVDDNSRGGRDQKPHDALASRFEPISFSRASSIVPTM